MLLYGVFSHKSLLFPVGDECHKNHMTDACVRWIGAWQSRNAFSALLVKRVSIHIFIEQIQPNFITVSTFLCIYINNVNQNETLPKVYGQ